MSAHSKHSAADAPTRGRLIRWARFYDVFVAIATLGRAGRIRDQTADLAGLRPGQTVLEVGCGTGELTQRARMRVGSSGRGYGIDPSSEMIAVARRKAAKAHLDIDYRVAAIESLPFEDATFDVVLSSVMMHHLPDDLKCVGLAEIRRVLKPGGRLFIVDFKRPTGAFAHLAIPMLVHHGMAHGMEGLPPIVTAAGFADVESGDMPSRSLGFVSARAPT